MLFCNNSIRLTGYISVCIYIFFFLIVIDVSGCANSMEKISEVLVIRNLNVNSVAYLV